MKKFLNEAKQLITENLFVKDIKCIFCGKELNKTSKYGSCDECLLTLPFNNKKVCKICGEKITSLADYCLNCKDNHYRYFTQARAPFLYEAPITTVIQNLKYFNGKYLAPNLSSFLVDEFVLSGWKVDLVIPIPLNKNRLKQRGFNQAELLCCKFKDVLNLNVDTTSFERVVDTPTQTQLTKKQREKNLKNAFKVTNKNTIKNKSILLIDDVFTTGSTMEEASKILLNGGAKQVYALTLAHVHHNRF